MTTAPFDLDDYLEKSRTTYAYFNQDKWWKPNQRPVIAIADMEPAWRLNCLRFLERRADSYERRYTFDEIAALGAPAYQEVAGEERDGSPVLSGRTFSEFDLMGDMASDTFDHEQGERHADPVAWIRGTKLYRALAEGLPDCSVALEALKERARHWSTCPAREDTAAECRCDEARAAVEVEASA